jgi:hypothetical protein
MRWLAALGSIVGLVLVAYAVWLLATPDYDGGRRPVGAIVLVAALLLVSVSAWLLRPRS